MNTDDKMDLLIQMTQMSKLDTVIDVLRKVPTNNMSEIDENSLAKLITDTRQLRHSVSCVKHEASGQDESPTTEEEADDDPNYAAMDLAA